MPILFAALAAAALTPASVPAPVLHAADPVPPPATAVALQAAETRMTVAVTIDGAGPFRFIVDSGATRTVVSSRLAALLGLPPAGMVELHSVGGASRVASVRIAALALGALPAQAIVAPVLEEGDLGAAGILGIDALAGKKVVIDLIRDRMTVAAGDRHSAPASGGEIVVVARRRYGQLVLADAAVAGERIWAIVDTGSMMTIGNGELRRRLVRGRHAAPVAISLTDVTGRVMPLAVSPVGEMRLGAWRLRGLSIAFSDVHAFDRFGLADKPSMLLGMDMMSAFSRVSIDFGRRTVRLLKRGEAPA